MPQAQVQRRSPRLATAPAALLLAAALALAGLACQAPTESARPAKSEPASPPTRIVSLAPSATEVLFALGLEDRVVGVTTFCDWPAAARDKPKVGGLKDPNLESVLKLAPDLVIATRDGNDSRFLAALDRLDIRALALQPSTLDETLESILAIGRATGREPEARVLVDQMKARIEAVRARAQAAPRVKVMVVYGRDPLVLAGPGVFADDMVRLAGGANVAADALMPYPRFSMESVLARAPEVIVEGAMGSEDAGAKAVEARAFWARWDGVPAARSGRVIVIDQDLIARPGPRIVDGLELLAQALHPELFPAGATEGGR